MKKSLTYGIPLLILLAGILSMLFFASFKERPPRKPPEVVVKIVDVEKVHFRETPVHI